MPLDVNITEKEEDLVLTWRGAVKSHASFATNKKRGPGDEHIRTAIHGILG